MTSSAEATSTSSNSIMPSLAVSMAGESLYSPAQQQWTQQMIAAQIA